MKNIPENLFIKIQQLKTEVKQDLRRKGLIVPTQNKNGSIGIGWYTIVKNPKGYDILDFDNEVIQGGINLPQTAILIANKLALGYHRDSDLIETDRKYGFADFEEQLYKRIMANQLSEKFLIYLTKRDLAQHKKKMFKQDILRSFEKLVKLV